MTPHYSVYTVLQASRRSWRIGQTKPVKVYYFAYADTIQTDALYLVAAKVAAAQRVNGDTVSDDSLAELDSVTGSDIVATLARIVTGDVQINSQSLQQAFAEANTGLRQANAIIGEYSIVDEVVETACPEWRPKSHTEGAVNGNGQVHGDRQLPAVSGNRGGNPKGPLLVPGQMRVTNGHAIRQPTLFTNRAAEANGKSTQPHLNGQADNHDMPALSAIPAQAEPLVPPVPRPQLFID